jgi:hypothetical protein
VYLESEKVDTANELNDYNASLVSLTLELGTWFIHFTGSGVIKGRFVDAVGNIMIVPLLAIVPHSSVIHTF